MDTTKTVIQGIGGVSISFVDMLPIWLRIGILLGVFLSVWIRLFRQIRNK